MSSRNRITLAHGGGGQLTDELIHERILPRIGNTLLNGLLDSAILPPSGRDRLAMTVDSYVVQPWRFPGGDIGRLAVCGTVNDLAVCGGEPIGIALSLILAEGFPMRDLDRVMESVSEASREAGVPVVTGDTKVVGRGQSDGIYITTAGIAKVPAARRLDPQRVQPGDVLIVNGPIGEHGLAVMLEREMPQVTSVLRSDAAPLNGLIRELLNRVPDVLFMRDATRSGLAGVACDLARDSGWHVTLDETRIPIRPETQHAADMLGLDPLEVANEGKVVVVVRPYEADTAIRVMRSHPLGKEACVIGHVAGVADGMCELRTEIGGRRIIQKPYGEQLPRIC
ncbi:MAG: hydrogenase expression/formation protein HypE [Phycisphaeraceae bacterium]